MFHIHQAVVINTRWFDVAVCSLKWEQEDGIWWFPKLASPVVVSSNTCQQ